MSLWRAAAARCRRFWYDVRPGREARIGAAWGSTAAALAGALVSGRYIDSELRERLRASCNILIIFEIHT